MLLHRCIIILLLLTCIPGVAFSQQQDSGLHKNISTQLINSAKPTVDSAFSIVASSISLKKPTGKPFIKNNGGFVAYNFNFRSNVDTPYVDRNLAQHNVTGQFNFAVAGIVPIQVNYWLRKSNSDYFRDIADVQVTFNANAFRGQVQSKLQERLLALEPGIVDSLTEKLYSLRNLQLDDLRRKLQGAFNPQKIAEAHEILRIPRITWDPYKSDSVNARREDSIKKAVGLMLQLYEKTKLTYDSLGREVDSLKKLHQEGLQKIERYRRLVKGGWKDFASMRNLQHQLKEYGLNDSAIPKKYQWLMGVRKFSLGRSTANHSELTAKNIAVNGINYEYNSWYYFAVVAGVVNYRFRDFVVSHNNRKPQTMVMVRAGIGSLERNYFILSAYRGQKQLFTGSRTGRPAMVPVSGISAESRWQLNRHSWLTAEVAKSIAPDFRKIPSQGNAKLDFSDRASQGMAFRLYSFVPATNTRFEAFYKHTGANFQSFGSFQTNADMESWYVKVEQNFFKRKLRIAGALRKNEFSNPFIVQNYKSNTVFKSITASFRMHKWPAITVGYQPMSQLTYLDDRISENRFQTLNATLYHQYNISSIRTASTVMYNRFFNNGSDTGFIYYNATNFYWTQHFFFKTFTTHTGASHTKNSGYMLNVLEGGIQPILKNIGAVGIGVRVNSFNNEEIKVGGYLNLNIKVFKRDMLYLNYEHGYLPGNSQKLVRNEMAGIQFVKNF